MNGPDIALAVETARSAAQAGAAAALAHFQKGVRVEIKPDRSPVTIADRESEAAILEVIRGRFPDHALLTEESGLHPGAAGTRWIVDPLDGTRGFVRGGPFWGPLVALEHEGEVVAGAMCLPVIGESWWAGRGLGCFMNGQRMRVSGVDAWRDSTLSVGELHKLLESSWNPGVARLAAAAAQARCYGDLASCAMLLRGGAEAWLEAGVQIWDLAPLKILVEEAGGVFTDLAGAPTIASGNALASNGQLHQWILSTLASTK